MKLAGSTQLYKKIEMYLEDQNFDKARSLCLRRIDSQPNDFVIKYYLGQALEGLKDYPGAVVYYEKAAIIAASSENDPIRTQLFLKTASLFKKMHKDKQALGYFAMLLEHDPHNTKALFSTGEIYFDAKDYPKAKEYFTRHLQVKPEHIITHFNLGEIYKISHNYPEAIKNYEYIIENETVDDILKKKVLVSLADCYISTKQWNKAKDSLLILMEDQDYYQESLLKLVQVKIMALEYNEAINLINNHLVYLSDAHKSLVLYMLGNIYYRQNKYLDAIYAWKKANGLNSNNKELRDLVEQYSLIIANPKLDGIYTEDPAVGVEFVQKLVKLDSLKKMIKKEIFWAFQAGNFYYAIYRVPQPLTSSVFFEIRKLMAETFNIKDGYTIYSLYGIDDSVVEEIAKVGVILIEKQDMVNLVNKNFL